MSRRGRPVVPRAGHHDPAAQQIANAAVYQATESATAYTMVMHVHNGMQVRNGEESQVMCVDPAAGGDVEPMRLQARTERPLRPVSPGRSRPRPPLAGGGLLGLR